MPTSTVNQAQNSLLGPVLGPVTGQEVGQEAGAENKADDWRRPCQAQGVNWVTTRPWSKEAEKRKIFVEKWVTIHLLYKNSSTVATVLPRCLK